MVIIICVSSVVIVSSSTSTSTYCMVASDNQDGIAVMEDRVVADSAADESDEEIGAGSVFFVYVWTGEVRRVRSWTFFFFVGIHPDTIVAIVMSTRSSACTRNSDYVWRVLLAWRRSSASS